MRLDRAWSLFLFISIAALPAVSNLLLTLVLVRGLGIAGFASWSIVEPLLLIFSGVGTMGTHFAVLFFSAKGDIDPRRVLGAAIFASLPCALGLSLIIGVSVSYTHANISIFSLVLPMVADALSLHVTASMRGQRRLGVWACFEVIRSFGLVLVSFAALRWSPEWVSSLNGFLLIRGILTGTAVIVVSAILRVRINCDRQLIVRMVRYGVPVSGSSVLGLAINSADRFMLAAFGMSSSVIASYAAHQRLTGLLGVLTVSPLQLWFPVEAMRRDAEAEGHFFQGVLVTICGGLVALSVSAFVAGPFLWPRMFPQIHFQPILFAILGISVIPRALAIVLNIGGLRENRTHLNAVATAVTGVTVLILGVPFIMVGGAIGAATARLVSFIVQAAGIGFISQKIAPVAYQFLMLLPFVVAAVTSMLVPGNLGSPLSLTALALTVSLIVFGIVLNRGAILAIFSDSRIV